MMKRFFFCFLVVSLGAVCSLRADDSIRAAQLRLKAGGFYSGEVNGNYDSDTAAAITRYQIRNGLQITGKLDMQTRHALGLSAGGEPKVPSPRFGEDVWRYLRKSDQAYIKRVMAMEARAAQTRQSPASSTSTPPPAVPPPVPATPPSATNPPPNSYDPDRLQDYIAAFVLAGLDPRIGAEAEFFADRVDYFGKQRVTRKKIRRDLQRYDNRWPERKFWIAGKMEVRPSNDRLEVSFPLRYELRSRSRRASGKVWKTLVLEKTGADDLQIVAVNERKMR